MYTQLSELHTHKEHAHPDGHVARDPDRHLAKEDGKWHANRKCKLKPQ